MKGINIQSTELQNQVNHLLQEIQHASLCYYLSDLHSAYTNFNAETKESIAKIPDEKYSIAEWNEAVEYITGSQCKFESVREAKEKISNNKI